MSTILSRASLKRHSFHFLFPVALLVLVAPVANAATPTNDLVPSLLEPWRELPVNLERLLDGDAASHVQVTAHTVVPIAQSRVMARALKDAGRPHTFIELPGEDHWLSRSTTRIRVLEETARFLETHLGRP